MPEFTRKPAAWECRGCPICEAIALAQVRYYDGSLAPGAPMLKLQPNEQ